jgi:hypothetical protein
MSRVSHLRHEFVDAIPDTLEDGILYVSAQYATAAHSCCCGCRNEVITPLSPTDWQLMFDGSVSLTPSIGNWSFDCQSHYWIERGSVRWAPRWRRKQIEEGRACDRVAKQRALAPAGTAAQPAERRRSRLRDFLRRLRFWDRA